MRIEELKERYGLKTASDLPSVAELKIPTGLPYFDYVTGGGIRRGSITLISGGAYSGKTTLALCIAANAEFPCYLDSESAITKELLDLRGIDNMEIFAPGDLQSMLAIAESELESGEHDLIVLDSPSICYPKLQSDDGYKDSALDEPAVGLGARIFSNWIRRANGLLRSHRNVALVVIQHERMDMNVGGYAPPRRAVALGKEQLYACDLHVRCDGERLTVPVQTPKGLEGTDTSQRHVLVALRCHWQLEKARLLVPCTPQGSFIIGLASVGDWEAGRLYLAEERFRYLLAINKLRVKKGGYYELPAGMVRGREALIDCLENRWEEIVEALQKDDSAESGGADENGQSKGAQEGSEAGS